MTSSTAQAWWRSLSVEVPVICAPMGGVAGGALAQAVSRAGALGMIGMGSSGSPDALTRELGTLARDADRVALPFGIGLVDWGIQRHPEMLEIALAAAPTLLSVSFGDFRGPGASHEWIGNASHLGIATITQVANADEAEHAAAAGVSAIVARGLEAGGHGNPEMARDTLLTEVVDRVGGVVPVLAAGAIRDHHDLAHVMKLGAAGAWVGTPFTACPESLSSAENQDILVRASQTEITREYDIAQGLPWPERFPERVVAGTPVNAGMGVGALTSVRSAAEVVDSFRLLGREYLEVRTR